jgi:hypothetical protein
MSIKSHGNGKNTLMTMILMTMIAKPMMIQAMNQRMSSRG